MSITRGFVTLATGDKHYYQLAANLLTSYKRQTVNLLPFTILAEEDNEYTRLFESTIIINSPERSFMDKMRLLEYIPYDETIFIDADCLIYKDINFLFDYFNEGIGVFSAVGESLPLDSEGGWFKKENIGKYSDCISYIAHLHGGMYFIRKDKEKINAFLNTCKDIIVDYRSFQFRMFNKPADEPIFALAMAIHNLPMIEYKPEIMCFFPSTTSFVSNILNQQAIFEVPWYSGLVDANIVHWGNINTKRAEYIREAERLMKNSKWVNIKYYIIKTIDILRDKSYVFKATIKKMK